MLDLLDAPFARFAAQIVAIIGVARIIGMAAARLGQPMVIAEILAGILLGPSLLGWAAPAVSAALFAPESLGGMNLVSQVGLVLFMFLIGLELDLTLLRGHGRKAIAISYAGIVLPFGLAIGLSLFLYPRFGTSAPFTTFALFIGASMSVTAFPVLARILAERQLLRSRLGAVAVASAAVDDVTAWCVVGFVLAVAHSAGISGALATTALAITYVVFMLVLIRPLLMRLAGRSGGMSQDSIALIVLLMFLSSWATEFIGVHALFGAFLVGAILPREGGFARALAEKLEDLVVIVLMPLFFAYSGLRTEIGLLESGYHWAVCALIVVVATVGKAGGAALAARVSGFGWREAGALGILLNTRGLMGLIVLNIGLDLGVISPTLFSMMIIMALVTTLIASPLLDRVYPAERLIREVIELAETAELPAPAAQYRLLACVSRASDGAALIAVARALAPRDQPAQVYALHLAAPTARAASEPTGTADDVLGPALAAAARLELEVKPLSFVSSDVAGDICRVAAVRDTNLILLGGGAPALGLERPEVARDVARRAPGMVAILVDRGLRDVRTVVVPLMGEPHDRAAVALAGRLASGGVEVTTVADGSGIDAALARSVDLVVLGVSGKGRAGLGPLGSEAARLVRGCQGSILLAIGDATDRTRAERTGTRR